MRLEPDHSPAGSDVFRLLGLARHETDHRVKLDYLFRGYKLSQERLQEALLFGNTLLALNNMDMSWRCASQIGGKIIEPESRREFLGNWHRVNDRTIDTAEEVGDAAVAAQAYYDSALMLDINLRERLSRSDRDGVFMSQLDLLGFSAENALEAADKEDVTDLKKWLYRTAFSAYSKKTDILERLARSARGARRRDFLISAHTDMLSSAEVARKNDQPKKEFNGYSIGSNLSRSIADEVGSKDRLSWLTTCYEERVRSAELAREAGDLRHAGISWSLAAKVIKDIQYLVPPKSRRDWHSKSYRANANAGVQWKELGDGEKAKFCFSLAHEQARVYRRQV